MKRAQFEVHASFERTHWWFTARRQIIKSILESVVPPSKDSLVIEIGCGTGGNVAALSTSYDCLGIDSDPTAIEVACERLPSDKVTCGVAPKDIAGPIQKARAILLLDVLEHVRDDFLLLSELVAAIPPGSYVILTVPADPKLWTDHDSNFGHFRRYLRSRLEATWNGLPVTCLLCSHFNSRLYYPIKWIRRLNRCLGRTSGKSGTDFVQSTAIVNRVLHGIFAGERQALLKAMDDRRQTGFARGVSLIAVLRREQGSVNPRHKPEQFNNDPFDPLAINDESKLANAIDYHH